MKGLDRLAEHVSWRIRRYATAQHRKHVFRRAMTKLAADPRRALAADDDILSRLVYGWGNEDWSAQHEYLRGSLQHALRAGGPILECGSGLSTLLLGAVAQQTGNAVWSLEHKPEWAARVDASLRRYRIRSVHLCVSPLKDHGQFSWYDPPVDQFPRAFAMVLCDGPPGDTKGGRYGLVPVMRTRLAPGAVILLDDAARPDEQRIAGRWAIELDARCALVGASKPYAVITVPGAGASP